MPAYARAGRRVRPFKPQNMSNNAAVTADGGEIGRAQALQARAGDARRSVHMNPVLLKPQIGDRRADRRAGQACGRRSRRAITSRGSRNCCRAVLDSFAGLSGEADFVLVEGAGSPAEINLRDGDIANMGFAEAADVPVILVGDIDRGGVIASHRRHHAVAARADAARIKGYLINKFRGDPDPVRGWPARSIETATGSQSLGVVPWFGRRASAARRRRGRA